MNRDKQFGYFHVSIKNELPRALFDSNNERAFVLSFLQDTLSMRTIVESPLGHRSLSTHIDLLAFSLVRASCQLALFATSRQSASILAKRLCAELQDYSESYANQQNRRFSITITRLSGPHAALHQTTVLHSQHEDWEYDRYSSIGFYLHGRRGDWMRLWRLSRLYEGDSQKYRALMKSVTVRRPGAEIVCSIRQGLHTINA